MNCVRERGSTSLFLLCNHVTRHGERGRERGRERGIVGGCRGLLWVAQGGGFSFFVSPLICTLCTSFGSCRGHECSRENNGPLRRRGTATGRAGGTTSREVGACVPGEELGRGDDGGLFICLRKLFLCFRYPVCHSPTFALCQFIEYYISHSEVAVLSFSASTRTTGLKPPGTCGIRYQEATSKYLQVPYRVLLAANSFTSM